MQALSLKPGVGASIHALGLFVLVLACGGNAAAQQAADPIEGVWEGFVTVHDCASKAVLRTFRASQVFHQGGTVSDTNSAPTSTRGPGFGTWARSGTTYTSKFRYFTYDNMGVPTGTARVTRTLTLSADGLSNSSTNSTVFEDTGGNVLRTVCSTNTGTRVL